MSVKKWIEKVIAVLVLTVGLLAIWHWSLILNVSKPTVLRVLSKQRIIPISPPTITDNSFSYPALGISAPLQTNASTSPLETQDWELIRKALRKGVSLAYTTPQFEQAPLAFIVGHSSDSIPQPYASIFAGLGQAQIGDTFQFNSQGKSWQYRVIKREILYPSDVKGFLSLAPAKGQKPRLALVTCWPVLTTQKRLVVVGEQI